MLKDFYTNFDEEPVGVKFDLQNNEESVETFRKENSFENFPLAMAYVPVQQFRQLYDTSEALQNGTLFKELNLPFFGYLKKGV